MEFTHKLFAAESGLDLPSAPPLLPANRISIEDARLPKLVATSMQPEADNDDESRAENRLEVESSSVISAAWGSQRQGSAQTQLTDRVSAETRLQQRADSPCMLHMQPDWEAPLSVNTPQDQPEHYARGDSDALAALLEESVEPVQTSFSDSHLIHAGDMEGDIKNTQSPPFPESSAPFQAQTLDASGSSLSASPPALDELEYPSPPSPQQQQPQRNKHQLEDEFPSATDTQPQPSSTPLEDEFPSPPDVHSSNHQLGAARPLESTQHQPHLSGIPRTPASQPEHQGGTQSHAAAASAPRWASSHDQNDAESVESIPEEIVEEEIAAADDISDDDCFTDIGSFRPLSGDCTMNQADLAAELADLAPPGMQRVTPSPGAQPTTTAPTQVCDFVTWFMHWSPANSTLLVSTTSRLCFLASHSLTVLMASAVHLCKQQRARHFQLNSLSFRAMVC